MGRWEVTVLLNLTRRWVVGLDLQKPTLTRPVDILPISKIYIYIYICNIYLF